MAPDVTELRSLGEDTSPGVERLLIAAYRRLTPAERLRQAADMFETARALLRERVRSEHGEGMPARETELLVAEHLYGPAFVDAIRRHLAAR